jgi:HK97 family phage major capsid protein
MTFKIDIGKDGLRIPELTPEQVNTAHFERCELLDKVIGEAGENLDPSKVSTVNFANGQEMATWVRNANADIDLVGKRVSELAEIEKAAQTARNGVVEGRKPANGRTSWAPGAEQRNGPPRPRSLANLVTDTEEFKAWQARGANGGIDLSFADVAPSELFAAAAQFRTMNTLFETGAGWAPESVRLPGFVPAVARPVQLIDILPMAETGQEKIVYMEETTRTHSAAEKAEGVAFAESTFALTEQESSVRKITDSVPVTDEQLDDVPQAESYLTGRLVFGLRQRLDTQVLTGNGTPPNLTGIKNTASIQTQAKGADPIEQPFFKAMTKLRVTGRVTPTHHLIHPTDWETIRLRRTDDGIYIWGNPSEAGPERMWGLPIVQIDADAAGRGYTISALPAWMSLFERRGIDIQMGYVGDQFKEGKRTIRGDTRWAFVVFRPAAICATTGLS